MTINARGLVDQFPASDAINPGSALSEGRNFFFYFLLLFF